jgi:2-dehydropantoate 2-reductase
LPFFNKTNTWYLTYHLKVRNTIPNITEENLPPYDYILLATKNTPDIPPTIASLVAPALPNNNTHTTLVLIQNGLNIEKPFLTTHPTTAILSGVSLIGSAEPSHGNIIHDEPDKLFIGGFPHPNPSISSTTQSIAQEFVTLYAAAGKTVCTYSPNVLHDRWRKLVYNACLNPICAIAGLDTGRIRLVPGAVENLVKPAMREIVLAAKVCANVDLGEDVVQTMVDMDPLESYLKPSMQQDLDKVRRLYYGNWGFGDLRGSVLMVIGQFHRVWEFVGRAVERGEGGRGGDADAWSTISACEGDSVAEYGGERDGGGAREEVRGELDRSYVGVIFLYVVASVFMIAR